MKHDFTDDVNGQIVGTHYGQAWVTYNGRKQGKTHYVRSEAEALSVCHKYIEEQKAGPAGFLIYPDVDGWMIHMDNV